MSTAPETLFVEERRRAILEELRQHGRVSVRALSEGLHVSAVTIRQDLRALEDSGLLERTYGGAVTRAAEGELLELSFHTRQGQNREAKDVIARAAAALIGEGDTIALDCSTTVYAMMPQLKQFKQLTVLTNSLMIAHSLLDSPQIEVLLPGGRLRRDSISVVGPPNGLPDVNVNIAFMSTRGITVSEGFSDIDPDEVNIKRVIATRAVTTVILADATKWGQVAPYTFARPSEVDRVITSATAPSRLVDALRATGVAVDLVPAETP